MGRGGNVGVMASLSRYRWFRSSKSQAGDSTVGRADRQTTYKAGLWLGFAFVSSFVIVGVIFVIVERSDPPANWLWYEVAKTCLQVASVIIFGGLGGW